MPLSRVHTCPVKGCSNERAFGHLLCPDCWSMLPSDTRSSLELRDMWKRDRMMILAFAVSSNYPLDRICFHHNRNNGQPRQVISAQTIYDLTLYEKGDVA